MTGTSEVRQATSDSPDHPLRRLWIGAMLAAIAWVCVCQTAAIVTTRSGVFWDDVKYHNQFLLDKAALQSKPFHQVVGYYLTSDKERPPLHRLLMIPALLADVSDYSLLCMYMFVISLLSVWLAYLLGKRVGGQVQGLLFAMLWALTNAYCQNTRMLMMEGACYLAMFGALYYMIRPTDAPRDGRRDWIWLGLIFGLGALSKLTYVAVMGPVFVVVLLMGRRSKPAFLLGPGQMLRAAGLGAAVAAPWWVMSRFHAIGYGFYASSFVRHSRGNGLWDKVVLYAKEVPAILIGPAGAVLLGLAAVGGLFMLARRGKGWTGKQKFAVLAGLAGALPIVLMSFVGKNQNLRLIAPAAIPLCLALTTIFAGVSWRRSPIWGAMLLACFVWQGAGLARQDVLHRYDHGWGVRPTSQISWDHLKALCDERQTPAPKIAYWGQLPTVNPPYLRMPWLLAGEIIDEPKWLWNSEDGELNWEELLKDIDSYDLVLAGPAYEGDPNENEPVNNAHNEEFFERMSRAPNFAAPVPVALPNNAEGLTVQAFFRIRPGERSR